MVMALGGALVLCAQQQRARSHYPPAEWMMVVAAVTVRSFRMELMRDSSRLCSAFLFIFLFLLLIVQSKYLFCILTFTSHCANAFSMDCHPIVMVINGYCVAALISARFPAVDYSACMTTADEDTSTLDRCEADLVNDDHRHRRWWWWCCREWSQLSVSEHVNALSAWLALLLGASSPLPGAHDARWIGFNASLMCLCAALGNPTQAGPMTYRFTTSLRLIALRLIMMMMLQPVHFCRDE